MIQRLEDVHQAWMAFKAGQVLAYPTEAVYGLGCDAFHLEAVAKIIQLKGRDSHKGFILLIADWPQLFGLIGDIPLSRLDQIKKTWPGPVTWIFPKSSAIPDLLTGGQQTIAIRMTAHPIAAKLCQYGPIVSTSANPQNQKPARSLSEVEAYFPEEIDGIVMGDLGKEQQPSAIYDVLTGQRLR